jgi:hypothetical protein
MNLRLVRVSEVLGVTLGILCVEGMPEFCTLEEAWRDNERQVSCIPAGTYTVKRVNSPKFGLTFEVTNVPARSNILFHSGNTHRDTLGCILIGTVFGKIDKDPAVLNSKAAFARFMQMMGGKTEAQLSIIDTCVGGRCH